MNSLATTLIYRLAPYVPNFLVSAYVRSQMQKAAQLTSSFFGCHLIGWRPKLEMRQSLRKMTDTSFGGAGTADKKKFSGNTERPVIFGMIGLPQTGKSTIAQAFTEAIGGVVIENNALRSFLNKRKEKPSAVFPYLNEVSYLMAKDAIELGFNPILDSDFANPIKRQMLEAFASGLGAEVRYIHVTCRKDLWDKRLVNENHDFGDIYHQAVGYEAFKPSHMHPEDHLSEHAKKLAECVKGEYERQEKWHTSLPTKNVISISNSGSQKVAEQAARIQGWKLLHLLGNTPEIRLRNQKMVEVSIPQC